jgi:hypothetical protein
LVLVERDADEEEDDEEDDDEEKADRPRDTSRYHSGVFFI